MKTYPLKYSIWWVVSSCTGTQRIETLTNCATTPCMDMKIIRIPPLYWYTRTAPIWCYAGGKSDPQFDRNANVDIQTIQTLLSLIEGEHHVSRAHSRASERYCQRAPFCARIPRKYRFTIENLSTSEYCPQGT